MYPVVALFSPLLILLLPLSQILSAKNLYLPFVSPLPEALGKQEERYHPRTCITTSVMASSSQPH